MPGYEQNPGVIFSLTSTADNNSFSGVGGGKAWREGAEGGERESHAESLLSMEPHMGLDFMTIS